MADKDDVDSTDESSASATNPTPTNGSSAFDSSSLDNRPVPDDGASDDYGASDEDGLEPDDLDPVAVGARSELTKSPAGGSGATSLARLKKDKATPKQKRAAVVAPRTGPVTFVKESVAELRKVVYPTAQQLLQYFVVVLIFVLFIIGIVSLLDLAFGAAILKIFS